jgi:MFS superfamily sulfate permease-like transporter
MDTFSFSSLLIGLGIGILLCIIFWIQGRIKTAQKIKSYVEENAQLKNHLNTQMNITAKGNEAVQQDLLERQRTIDNLKSTISALKEKPGRDKLRVLYVYDKAIHIMFEKHPGFATMWAGVLKEAETEIEKSETGVLPLIKKVFKPGPPMISAKNINSDKE